MLVTHDQNEAMALGDRLAVMRNGVIVQSGRPIDVYENPDDIFVAQFVGAPSMNVIRATVCASDDVAALRIGSHRIPLRPLDDRALRRFPSILKTAGRDVGVGVRSDALRQDPAGPLRLSVMVTEHDEMRKLPHLAIDAPRIISRDHHRVRVDEQSDSTIVMSVKPTAAVSLWKPFHVTCKPAKA